MKRKKFIKMLMAHGIGRDAASAAAWLAANDLRVSYHRALGDFLTMLGICRAYHMTGHKVTQPTSVWLRYGWEWMQ